MRLLSNIFSSIDWFLMLPVGIIAILGLSTLYSIDPIAFRSQLIFLIGGFIIFLLFTQINPNIIRHYGLPIYIASLVLLTIVLIIGLETRGSVRWIDIFGIRLQFSELLKPFLAISLASFLSTRRSYDFISYVIIFVLLVPITLLIFIQPDLGNTLIYMGVVVASLLVYGFPLRYFAASLLLWISTLPFFWFILHDYQKQRIMVFLNPSQDPLGKSYNSIQAVIAVGSGMFLGKGLGQGTQSILSFLPENHTDFIFATMSEEFGFIGSSILILAFAFLLYRIYAIYQNETDLFSQIFTIIVFFIIFVHFFINVGMNIGILPVVGVTLPFTSYGGSSILSNFILLGLLFAISKGSRRPNVLEIK